MLKKVNRLNSSLFNTCFAEGRRIHNKYTTVIYVPQAGFLCSVVVGKKVFKKAVARNRLRRQIYAEVSNLIKNQNYTGAYIILVKPNLKDLSRLEIRRVIKEEVGRALK